MRFAFAVGRRAPFKGPYLAGVSLNLPAAPFSPAALFTTSLKGFWFDPSDATTVIGNPVSQINDKSGNANHAVQATVANQPGVDTVGTFKLLNFDGVGDGLTVPAISLERNMSIFAVIEMAVGETGFVTYHDAGVDFIAVAQDASTSSAGAAGGATRPGSLAVSETYWIDGQPVFDPVSMASFGTIDNRDTLYDALAPTGTRRILEIRDIPMENWATFSIANYGGFGLNARIGEVIGLPNPDAIARKQVLDYLSARYGIALAPQGPNVRTAAFGQEGDPFHASGVYRTSPFARLQYTTEATSIDIKSWNNVHGVNNTFAELGLKVDGVWQAVQLLGVGHQSNTVALPAGPKTIEIINGMQINASPSINPYTPTGSWVTYITGNAAITQVDLDGNCDVLCYGDSITVGRTVTKYTRDTAALILRNRLTASVGVEGADGKTLYNDMGDAQRRAWTKAMIKRWGPKVLIDRLGVNDYILNAWTAAAYGVAYRQFLDDVHEVLPNCKIICVTQYPRIGEGANTAGSTLEEYRAQKRAAAAERPLYCSVLEGPSVYPASDLVDTVHPGDAGNLKMANAEEPLILALL